MVAFDWESPTTFGTVTVVRTVDVVEEGPGAEVELEVDGGPTGLALVDRGCEV
jgi:hypothetical protein